MKTLLEAQRLTKSFGGLVAVKARAGEFNNYV